MDIEIVESVVEPDQQAVWEAERDRFLASTPRTIYSYIAGMAGCLSGDTVVDYNRGARTGGRPEKLSCFYRKFNGLSCTDVRGRRHPGWDLTLPTFLLSLGDDGVLFYNRVVAVYESGVKELVRLNVSGEQGIRSTPDHPFMTPNGYVAAGDLQVGDKVLVRGTMLAMGWGGHRDLSARPPRVIVNTKWHPFGAYKNVDGYEYMRVPRARLVVEAHLNEVPYDEFVHALKHNQMLAATFRFIPTDFEVHHDDENTLNDVVENLVVMSKAEHARLHNQRGNFNFDAVQELAVTKVQHADEEMTYDVQMESPANNFVANGLIVHNTGKTFYAKAWAEYEAGLVLTATTGIAAINLGEGTGTTINSLLSYFDTASLVEAFTAGFLQTRLRRLRRAGLRRIILDEVSMLDAEQLTVLVRAIDEVNAGAWVMDAESLEEEQEELPPLGLTCVGDFCQLAPIKARFAFESPEWPRFAESTIRLTEIRRQGGQDFIRALHAVRSGRAKDALDYFRPFLQSVTDPHYDGPTILAKNEPVDRFNALRHDALPGAPLESPSRRWGQQRPEWKAIPEVLRIRPGALVMVLANRRNWEFPHIFDYVNGDLGVLRSDDGSGNFVVDLHRGGVQIIESVTRDVLIPLEPGRRAALKAEGHEDRIKEKYEIVGQITYLPLRLAWASTCHKTQGLTMDKVQINIRDHFWATSGMLYVGLSRVRSIEGLRLVGTPEGFLSRCRVDPKVLAWI